MVDDTREFAVTFVDELIRCGISDAVIAPGSRSTPIAVALLERPEIEIHVRVDERSAAFLALGLAKSTLSPVPVLCTSGTAAAHLHAAVLEADQSCVPLIVLTADRPVELHGIGANQTIYQQNLYGDAVRHFLHLDVDGDPDPKAAVRAIVKDAVWASETGLTPGPVHLNIPLREPLVPKDSSASSEPPHDWHRQPTPAWQVVNPPVQLLDRIAEARRGVIVCGDFGHVQLEILGQEARWPIIAEPHSNQRGSATALRHADALLSSAAFVAAHRPDLVVVVGRVGLSRTIVNWLSTVPHIVVDPYGRNLDVARSAQAIYHCAPALASRTIIAGDAGWLPAWQQASDRAAAAVDEILDETDRLSEPRTARDVFELIPSGGSLVVASSMPIRDLDLFMRTRPSNPTIYANRGVSGIDGFVSTAMGIAIGNDETPTYALTGDLSMLHDINGLMPGPTERPDIAFVVINNDGGGIFSLLEQGKAVEPDSFEILFGTPHGVDFAQVAAAYKCHHQQVTTASELATALQPRAGVRIIEVRTDRAENAALHQRLREAAAAAVAAG